MSVQTIHFGDDGLAATRELAARFDKAAPGWAGFLPHDRIEALRRQIGTLESIDRHYGGHARAPLEGCEELVGGMLSELAHFEAARGSKAPDEEVGSIVIGVALWAMRHGVAVSVPEPVVNALAQRSNAARSRAELAAAFGLMQGFIAHVAPRLSGDLERSNPERPWRLLHLNLAVTAIRTEDGPLMDYAFDALERALPDERAGFFAEALARSLSPRVNPEVRRRIGERHLKWTQGL